MQRFAEEFGVDVEIDSAGTHGYHAGEPADSRMQSAAEARGYELTSKARKVTAADLLPERFDLVLAMDSDNHAILVEMAGGVQTHIRMFSDYLDDNWKKRGHTKKKEGGRRGRKEEIEIERELYCIEQRKRKKGRKKVPSELNRIKRSRWEKKRNKVVWVSGCLIMHLRIS